MGLPLLLIRPESFTFELVLSPSYWDPLKMAVFLDSLWGQLVGRAAFYGNELAQKESSGQLLLTPPAPPLPGVRFPESNVQHGDPVINTTVTCSKAAKRVNLKCSHDKEEMVVMGREGGVSTRADIG